MAGGMPGSDSLVAHVKERADQAFSHASSWHETFRLIYQYAMPGRYALMTGGARRPRPHCRPAPAGAARTTPSLARDRGFLP
jgi:hypothetical protein